MVYMIRHIYERRDDDGEDGNGDMSACRRYEFNKYEFRLSRTRHCNLVFWLSIRGVVREDPVHVRAVLLDPEQHAVACVADCCWPLDAAGFVAVYINLPRRYWPMMVVVLVLHFCRLLFRESYAQVLRKFCVSFLQMFGVSLSKFLRNFSKFIKFPYKFTKVWRNFRWTCDKYWGIDLNLFSNTLGKLLRNFYQTSANIKFEVWHSLIGQVWEKFGQTWTLSKLQPNVIIFTRAMMWFFWCV